MYIKIHKPLDVNRRTSAYAVNYLEKESEEMGQLNQGYFFDQNSEKISALWVIPTLDMNRAKLSTHDAKFYMLTINPSEAEQRHIIRKATGRSVNSIQELNPEELKAFEKELKDYSRGVMDLYARNFNRGLTGDDILYFGRVEHQRKVEKDSESTAKYYHQHIKLAKEDIPNIYSNNNYYMNRDVRGIAHRLKKGDNVAMETAAKDMVKTIPDNAILIPMPSSPGHATYTKTLSDEIAKLNPSLEVHDVMKGAKRDKLFDIKKTGNYEQDKDYFGFRLTGEIPSDRPVFFVDNILATGQTYVHAKDLIPDAKIAVYAVNEDLAIKESKLEHRQAIKTGQEPKIAELKSGLNSHVHILVSRKDITNTMKLSPLAVHKNSLNTLPDGSKCQIGFDRNAYTEASEKLFDEKFKYERTADEMFRVKNALKNSTQMIARNAMKDVVPEELQEVKHYAKMAGFNLSTVYSKNLRPIFEATNAHTLYKENVSKQEHLSMLASNTKYCAQTDLVAKNLNVQVDSISKEFKALESYIPRFTNDERNPGFVRSFKENYIEKRRIEKPFNREIRRINNVNIYTKEEKKEKVLKVLEERTKATGLIDKVIASNFEQLGKNIVDPSNYILVDQSIYNQHADNLSQHLKDASTHTQQFYDTFHRGMKNGFEGEFENIQASTETIGHALDALKNAEKEIGHLEKELNSALEANTAQLRDYHIKGLYGNKWEFKDAQERTKQARKNIYTKKGYLKRAKSSINQSRAKLYEARNVVYKSNVLKNQIDFSKKVYTQKALNAITSNIPVVREITQAVKTISNLTNPVQLITMPVKLGLKLARVAQTGV